MNESIISDPICPTAKRITSLLQKGNQQLLADFIKASGFRGLFDHLSAEWKGTPVDHKIKLVRRLVKSANIPLRDLTQGTVEVMERHGHPRASSCRAVLESLEYYMEALL